MRPRLASEDKPIKGHILSADFFRWPTNDERLREPTGLHVICVTGYKDRISPTATIRTSWVEKLIENELGRFVETRNSIYRVDMNDTDWKVLHDEMKHEKLDVERMKR